MKTPYHKIGDLFFTISKKCFNPMIILGPYSKRRGLRGAEPSEREPGPEPSCRRLHLQAERSDEPRRPDRLGMSGCRQSHRQPRLGIHTVGMRRHLGRSKQPGLRALAVSSHQYLFIFFLSNNMLSHITFCDITQSVAAQVHHVHVSRTNVFL